MVGHHKGKRWYRLCLRGRRRTPRTRGRSDNRLRLVLEPFEDRCLPSFLAPSYFDTDSFPRAVAIGDLTGNGIPDLVTVNSDATLVNSVSVLLGNGDGTFQAHVDYPVGNFPNSVAIGDLNGDGIPDLVTANGGIGTNGVSVLLGNGDGTFQPAIQYVIGQAHAVVIGDFNGDGIPDLAVTIQFPLRSAGAVLLGNGDGTFQDPIKFTTGISPNSMVVGDFNGDGIPDLAVANQGSSNVSVVLGNGDGTFQAPVNYYPVGKGPESIAVADFNGDGIPDLVTANLGDNNVSVLLGNGDGSFQPAAAIAAGNQTDAVAVGDLNGDGIPDLAVANYSDHTVSVLLGNGDGSFQARQVFAIGSSAPYDVAVADLNGDGAPDVVTTDFYTDTKPGHTVAVLLNANDWTAPATPGAGDQVLPSPFPEGRVPRLSQEAGLAVPPAAVAAGREPAPAPSGTTPEPREGSATVFVTGDPHRTEDRQGPPRNTRDSRLTDLLTPLGMLADGLDFAGPMAEG